jgi:hypothetical protein
VEGNFVQNPVRINRHIHHHLSVTFDDLCNMQCGRPGLACGPCKPLHVFDYVTPSNKSVEADTFSSLSPDPREAIDEQEQDHKAENTSAMENTSTTLEPVLAFLAHSLATMETTFNKLPGSAVIQRYVKSSHQNDPGRTLLELILIIFAIRTLLQSRTQADRGEKHFIRFTDKVSRVMCALSVM